jgi:hypothetical protein
LLLPHLTAGQRHDITQTPTLTDGFEYAYLIADDL